MTALESARAERESFAAFLETLSPEQWQAPTLCERWNVREVMAMAGRRDALKDLSGPGKDKLAQRF